jgi:hypothetical protein
LFRNALADCSYYPVNAQVQGAEQRSKSKSHQIPLDKTSLSPSKTMTRSIGTILRNQRGRKRQNGVRQEMRVKILRENLHLRIQKARVMLQVHRQNRQSMEVLTIGTVV